MYIDFSYIEGFPCIASLLLQQILCVVYIPMDGTFNQTKPLDLLVGSRVCFSFDPRSATDRWPIVFLERVVSTGFLRSG